MQSLTAAARQIGVSRPVVDDLAAAGCLGDIAATPSGHFVQDDVVARLAHAPVLRSLSDLASDESRSVIHDLGLVVLRVRPWRDRTDSAPETTMGYSPVNSGSNGDGYNRYWSLGRKAEQHINTSIEDRGGQPVAVSVRGFVVKTHKIISPPIRTAHGVVFDLTDAGMWGDEMLGKWLEAGAGPVLTYWPAAFRSIVRSRD